MARRAGVHPDREALLIAVLGEDLPGAVIVRRVEDLQGEREATPAGELAGPLRFSLAGAQLKFSVLYLVATVTYLNDQKLGLKLSGESRFEQIQLRHFGRLAEKVGVPAERVTRVVRETIQRAMASWPTETRDPPRMAALRAHVERLPFLAEAG